MAKKLSEFLQALVKKSGVELSPEQKELLSGETFAALEIPDEIITPIDTSLISLRDAKNNHSEIRNFYHKQVYDGVDAVMNNVMDELELDDAARNEIAVERNATKRLPLLVKKAAELERKKATANQPDKAAINKLMDDAQAEIRALKAKMTADAEQFKEMRRQDRIAMKKETLVLPYKTIFDDLDPEVKAISIRNLIDKELQDNNAKFDFDEHNNFVLVKNDGTNFFGENHTQEFPATFVEKVLSRSKVLKTTAPTPPQGQNAGDANGNNNNQTPNGGNVNGNGGGANNQSHLLKSLNGDALKTLEINAANPVFGGGVGV